MDLGADDSRFCVAAQDNSTDIGYLIYTEKPVSERFSNMVAGASDRFFAVSYNASNHTWYYHTIEKLYAFVPSATDRLVAVLDFGSDTAHILTGPQDPIGGIEAGVVVTDLPITPQVSNGVYNNGEFSLSGTYIEFETTPRYVPRDQLNSIHALPCLMAHQEVRRVKGLPAQVYSMTKQKMFFGVEIMVPHVLRRQKRRQLWCLVRMGKPSFANILSTTFWGKSLTISPPKLGQWQTMKRYLQQ